MGVYVICHPQNAVSASRIGIPVLDVNSDVPGGSAVVNWGCSNYSFSGRSCPYVLNDANLVAKTVNKGQFLRSLIGKPGISVPEYKGPGEVISEGKWVVRQENHSEGSGFRLIERGGSLRTLIETGEHATRFIENTREYRVWFWRYHRADRLNGEEGFLTARRVPMASEGQTASDPCRSKWGYSFTDNFSGGVEMLKAVLQIVPLNFGAADMLWDTVNKKWYLLEINTAPSLDHKEVRNFLCPKIRNWAARFQNDNPSSPAHAIDEANKVALGAAKKHEDKPRVIKIKSGDKEISIDISGLL